MSSDEGLEHCCINQNAKFSLRHFDTAEAVVYDVIPANKCLFIFCIERKIRVDGADINERNSVRLWESILFPVHCDARAHFPVTETPVNQK